MVQLQLALLQQLLHKSTPGETRRLRTTMTVYVRSTEPTHPGTVHLQKVATYPTNAEPQSEAGLTETDRVVLHMGTSAGLGPAAAAGLGGMQAVMPTGSPGGSSSGAGSGAGSASASSGDECGGANMEECLVGEEMLVLPSSGALVLPLAEGSFLVGLLVVEPDTHTAGAAAAAASASLLATGSAAAGSRQQAGFMPGIPGDGVSSSTGSFERDMLPPSAQLSPATPVPLEVGPDGVRPVQGSAGAGPPPKACPTMVDGHFSTPDPSGMPVWHTPRPVLAFSDDEVVALRLSAPLLAKACSMELRSNVRSAQTAAAAVLARNLVREAQRPVAAINTFSAMLVPRTGEGEPERDMARGIAMQGRRLADLLKNLDRALASRTPAMLGTDGVGMAGPGLPALGPPGSSAGIPGPPPPGSLARMGPPGAVGPGQQPSLKQPGYGPMADRPSLPQRQQQQARYGGAQEAAVSVDFEEVGSSAAAGGEAAAAAAAAALATTAAAAGRGSSPEPAAPAPAAPAPSQGSVQPPASRAPSPSQPAPGALPRSLSDIGTAAAALKQAASALSKQEPLQQGAHPAQPSTTPVTSSSTSSSGSRDDTQPPKSFTMRLAAEGRPGSMTDACVRVDRDGVIDLELDGPGRASSSSNSSGVARPAVPSNASRARAAAKARGESPGTGAGAAAAASGAINVAQALAHILTAAARLASAAGVSFCVQPPLALDPQFGSRQGARTRAVTGASGAAGPNAHQAAMGGGGGGPRDPAGARLKPRPVRPLFAAVQAPVLQRIMALVVDLALQCTPPGGFVSVAAADKDQGEQPGTQPWTTLLVVHTGQMVVQRYHPASHALHLHTAPSQPAGPTPGAAGGAAASSTATLKGAHMSVRLSGSRGGQQGEGGSASAGAGVASGSGLLSFAMAEELVLACGGIISHAYPVRVINPASGQMDTATSVCIRLPGALPRAIAAGVGQGQAARPVESEVAAVGLR
uniref:Uncharacterized protein n=1 Tax=Chlamydomonas leiostraca TaxID=1034604 RepID=A0A7S0RKW5_9CHLO